MTFASNVQTGSQTPWYLIDASRSVKPLIWQERVPYTFQAVDKDEDERVFMRDRYLYGIRARASCGFGLWQLAFGSKAALTAANLKLAFTAMSGFRGDRGHLLGIRATHLIVPTSLEFTARELLLTDEISGTTNTLKGLVQLVVSPYLD